MLTSQLHYITMLADVTTALIVPYYETYPVIHVQTPLGLIPEFGGQFDVQNVDPAGAFYNA